MNFFLDENFPKVAINYLKDLGYNVIDIRSTENEGLDDYSIFKHDNRLFLLKKDGSGGYYSSLFCISKTAFSQYLTSTFQHGQEAINMFNEIPTKFQGTSVGCSEITEAWILSQFENVEDLNGSGLMNLISTNKGMIIFGIIMILIIFLLVVILY